MPVCWKSIHHFCLTRRDARALAALGTLLIAAVLRGVGVRFRVLEQAENLGIDVQEHGEEAYAERVGSPQLF